jgi:hypothetical protein
MTGRRREGNRTDRRILPVDATSVEERNALIECIRYVGSGNHKLRPSDYGFVPSHNPRPSKSPCDELRAVPVNEARELFEKGIMLGMVSRLDPHGAPKYVWSVDDAGEVYEAKAKPEREREYHGYRIGDDERDMRRYILDEWKKRCNKR